VSGRNCSDPVARLRNAGVSGHRVAHLLGGLDDLLCLWPEHDVLARISSNRCAKRERKQDACASDRPTAQATWSAYCFHALSVIPLRILRKLIFPSFWDKKPRFSATMVLTINPSKGSVPGEDWWDELLLLHFGCLPLQRVSHRWQLQIPTSNLPPTDAQR